MNSVIVVSSYASHGTKDTAAVSHYRKITSGHDSYKVQEPVCTVIKKLACQSPPRIIR